MSISDQGWAAITAYEYSAGAANEGKRQSKNLTISLMVEHLYNVHKLSVYKIAKELRIKRVEVHRILEANKKDED